MYIDYYTEDPDYFGLNDSQPKAPSSYYYDGNNVYRGGYGKIVSGQDPCYYTNMRNQQRAQNPFANPTTRRNMYGADGQYYAPQQPYGADPNYFNQEPMYYGYGSADPQYFGYGQANPNESRRYGNTPYTPRAYQAYQAPQPAPQPAPVAPQQGLNTGLFAQQRGYSNPINQHIPQQVPQRQLLRVSCPSQTNGFGANRYNTPRMPSNPGIDWSALSNINKGIELNQGYTGMGQYGQQRTIPVPQPTDNNWYEIARANFGR